jgi:uncharacterized protein (DUF2147 family)
MHARTRLHHSLTRRLAGAAFLAALAGPVAAAPAGSGPAGDWTVANGKAVIRVVNCRGQYWGLVAWEQNPGGADVHNPNTALRSRPTLGMPILLGMAPSSEPNSWHGEIYNSQDGRTYSGRITLADPNTLKVEGCVLGFLCGGENWHRASGTSAFAQAPARHTRGRQATALRAEPPSKVCSSLVR